MKLVSLISLIIITRVDAAHEHLTFRPHYQNQYPGIFSTENSVYLPPESNTPMPYLSIKDFNNLPFPYLPSSSNNGRAMFPTPFPFIITSSLVPFDENHGDNDRNTNRRDEHKSTVKPPQIIRNYNRTERVTPTPPINREMRAIPNNFKLSQQIDRNDLKPFPFAANNLPNTMKNADPQRASPRSLIISPDNNKVDQIKSGSFLAPQYLTSSGLFVSSTVEPAIPILRLSNEMDLDGSFSYEALGADQTHYVQHSRMENFGTDKQEQVVEGSYSYVGDNGQTYTVHYIADSNGFRATGEHLPVAPPIPEIIQRAIQYNLAEEARNPPIYKNPWEYGNNENEISESEKVQRFAFAPPQNLFTGKTPESFSHTFSQASNKQNNLIATASTNTVKTIDFTTDQMKPKVYSETISPQITFLASQGAHIPSINTGQQQTQQSIARMFTTEKPTMPQLMNYESTVKDADQENNKALWRWQYGISADNNQSSNKNTISRSSGDDVIVNFNDMTPEQYSHMIKSEIQHDYNEQANTSDKAPVDENQLDKLPQYSTASSITPIQYESLDKHISKDYKHNTEMPHKEKKSNNHQARPDTRAKLITLSEFLPPSQTITQSYDYVDTYGARNTKIVEEDISNLNVIPLNKITKTHDTWSNTNFFDNSNPFENIYQESFKSSTPTSSKFTDFIIKESDQHFKPVVSFTTEESIEPTTEVKLVDSLKENIFLKSIFSSSSKNVSDINRINEPNGYNLQPKHSTQTKSDKSIKYFSVEARPFEESKELNKKPIDMADVLRFMSSKTNFESSKIRPRIRLEYNGGQKNERSEFDQQDSVPKNEKNYGNWNHQQQEEIKGVIKNYKVLQRNNNGYSNEERMDHLRRISPPTPGNMQSPKLPPLGRAGPSIKSYLPPIYV